MTARYNPTWHAVVGRNFGSYVTHETKHFIYFYLGQAPAEDFMFVPLQPEISCNMLKAQLGGDFALQVRLARRCQRTPEWTASRMREFAGRGQCPPGIQVSRVFLCAHDRT